jgi:hypothetical protein
MAGHRRVKIGTSEENRPARRVLERVGAQEIGTGSQALPNGVTVTAIWYLHDASVAEPNTLAAHLSHRRSRRLASRVA